MGLDDSRPYMRKRLKRSAQFRRASSSSSSSPAAAVVAMPRWYDGAWQPMLSAGLLTLAFSPVSQFYLAWVGLVPLLLFVRRAATTRRLFLWSWGAGVVFFALNIWWLGFVTVPGTMGSVVYMGLYWGLAAVVLRCWGEGRGWKVEGGENAPSSSTVHALPSTFSPFLVAAVWTGCEWVRGNLGTGWPWSFLGYTQTPVLAMCQVADVVGVYGVTFWVVAVNAVMALLVLARFKPRPLAAPLMAVAATLGVVLVYGVARIAQTRTTPGPRVMVVQSNYPQSNTGAKGAFLDEIVAFHVRTTRRQLAQEHAAGRSVDLVAWSETMMPTLNRGARDFTRGSDLGRFLQDVYDELASLCFDYRAALIAGGEYAGKMMLRDGKYIDLDRRNAAYFFEPTGVMSDLRYDKVHLVPFGEYVPFKETIPPLYRLFMWFSPYDFDYNLVPGGWDALTVFTLHPPRAAPATPRATQPVVTENSSRPYLPPASSSQEAREALGFPRADNRDGEENRDGSYFTARFVVPICFEDADPRLVARMFDGGGSKRADFIVNLTNDGWFSQPQLSQHLQIARFRSIENRVPTARSVNTGISAFIDSVGRVYARLPAQVEETLTATLPLDGRYTLYTRWGDAFAAGCTVVTVGVAAWGCVHSWRRRRMTRAAAT